MTEWHTIRLHAAWQAADNRNTTARPRMHLPIGLTGDDPVIERRFHAPQVQAESSEFRIRLLFLDTPPRIVLNDSSLSAEPEVDAVEWEGQQCAAVCVSELQLSRFNRLQLERPATGCCTVLDVCLQIRDR